jgi:hypothetical protein
MGEAMEPPGSQSGLSYLRGSLKKETPSLGFLTSKD